MGPFPHDAPQATISAENPAGTDGFEFVEFAHPEPAEARRAVPQHGLRRRSRGTGRKDDHALPPGRHQLPAERRAGSHAAALRRGARPLRARRWPGAWSTRGTRCKRAVALGATEYTGDDKSLDVPAVIGIGGSLLYFVDTYGDKGSRLRGRVRLAGRARPEARRASASTTSTT